MVVVWREGITVNIVKLIGLAIGLLRPVPGQCDNHLFEELFLLDVRAL
jgi:hypothetical protein